VISGLGGNSGAGANTQNTFALLQSLRNQETAARAQLAESSKRYGENWPAVAEERGRLAAIENSIQDETRRLSERARSDYEISLRAEDSARTAFDRQKELASRITGSAVALRLARQEAGESRALYAGLQTRLQQAGILGGLHSGNFVVVTPALVPAADHPATPNLPLLLTVALAAGTTLGSVGAIVRELSDDCIHSAVDLEGLLDPPLFAALPPEPVRRWYRRLFSSREPSSVALAAAAAPDLPLPGPASPQMEALQRLRASLLLSSSEIPPQVILVTPSESTPPRAKKRRGYREESGPRLALNLAAVLAQHGSPTLYIDANLRGAPPPGAFRVDPGLSDLLAGSGIPAPESPAGVPPLLSVIHSGARPPCPSELIASRRMAALLNQWRAEFFHIVIDGPASAFADSLVLAQQADAVLVCMTAGKSRRSTALTAFYSLSRQMPDRAVLGLVLHGVPHARA
jgi:succinoglycan biosynthesis transport protein ExoP